MSAGLAMRAAPLIAKYGPRALAAAEKYGPKAVEAARKYGPKAAAAGKRGYRLARTAAAAAIAKAKESAPGDLSPSKLSDAVSSLIKTAEYVGNSKTTRHVARTANAALRNRRLRATTFVVKKK